METRRTLDDHQTIGFNALHSTSKGNTQLKKLIAFSLLLEASALQLLAGAAPPVPEIGATTAAGALTLIGGAMLVLRSRRRK
jgi:hypothetical protein